MFFTQPCFEWTVKHAVTRDIPLMSCADVYRDIVNTVVQNYGGNIVYIYIFDKNGAWIALK